MSGPVRDIDLTEADTLPEAADRTGDADHMDGIEVREGRHADVSGLAVTRVLPTKGRRTVGAWCFVDLMGPVDPDDPDPLEVGPHPHIGLSTVTWLLEGEALHTDSLGTEQVIRAGQLNLMTAGRGISHAELATHPPFRGAQLWIAQPEATRHGSPAFEHHAELPRIELPGTGGQAEGSVLIGRLAGAAAGTTSPARADTPLIGLDLRLRPGRTIVPLEPRFEHAVAPLDGPVKVGGHVVEPGWLALVPAGADELPLEVRSSAGRVLLLGGVPLGEPVAMWWNFVARDRDELTAAWRDWNDRTGRFGAVASPLRRIEAPPPPWIRPDGSEIPARTRRAD
jgi:redox-sensitive bicupin YhaK (pirin superfamily)